MNDVKRDLTEAIVLLRRIEGNLDTRTDRCASCGLMIDRNHDEKILAEKIKSAISRCEYVREKV